MSEPQVSIIIATYNWSSVLRLAVQSVLGQRFQDFELIVVGDGCTDDSQQVVESFGDPRIRWHNLEKNTGSQSIPNNTGLEMARGKYIAYHGHDDIWHPAHLGLLAGALERSGADLAHSVCVMIGPPETGVRIATGILDGRFTADTFVPPSSVMHRRDVVAKSGPWRHYREVALPPDKEFLLRVWKVREQCAAVDQLTVFKFNSAWRRNSYVEKPCHEQAEYLRRIAAEPDFIANEWKAIARAYVLNKTTPPHLVKLPDAPEALPPGWLVEQWRKTRGLEPQGPTALPVSAAPARIYRRSKRGLGRMFERMARRLG